MPSNRDGADAVARIKFLEGTLRSIVMMGDAWSANRAGVALSMPPEKVELLRVTARG